MYQQTSLEAFEQIQKGLNNSRRIVFDGLKRAGKATNAMIADRLQLPINCITPRMKELRDLGLVEESHREKCLVTKNNAIWWKIK